MEHQLTVVWRQGPSGHWQTPQFIGRIGGDTASQSEWTPFRQAIMCVGMQLLYLKGVLHVATLGTMLKSVAVASPLRPTLVLSILSRCSSNTSNLCMFPR